MASSNKPPVVPAPLKVLTIYNVMGEHQSFNNQNYSWNIDRDFVRVFRNDGKWMGYFPCANITMVDIEEAEP